MVIMSSLAGVSCEFEIAKSQILFNFEITSLKDFSMRCCAQRVIHLISRTVSLLQKEEEEEEK
ncbi:hypothetical protein RDI58_014902 [Solanum bulbocastanum]|uniref:Uncharacterized protein n=1 Tax=Solanum bulbocastanum TaxID=147425 RepID=A0AAN8TJH4_SOLBU